MTDAFLFNNLGAGTYEKPWVGSSASKSEMASFFGRVNYTYKDRYLLTATLRADGASNFAKITAGGISLLSLWVGDLRRKILPGL